jgi:hypothetical protein
MVQVMQVLRLTKMERGCCMQLRVKELCMLALHNR